MSDPTIKPASAMLHTIAAAYKNSTVPDYRRHLAALLIERALTADGITTHDGLTDISRQLRELLPGHGWSGDAQDEMALEVLYLTRELHEREADDGRRKMRFVPIIDYQAQNRVRPCCWKWGKTEYLDLMEMGVIIMRQSAAAAIGWYTIEELLPTGTRMASDRAMMLEIFRERMTEPIHFGGTYYTVVPYNLSNKQDTPQVMQFISVKQ